MVSYKAYQPPAQPTYWSPPSETQGPEGEGSTSQKPPSPGQDTPQTGEFQHIDPPYPQPQYATQKSPSPQLPSQSPYSPGHPNYPTTPPTLRSTSPTPSFTPAPFHILHAARSLFESC